MLLHLLLIWVLVSSDSHRVSCEEDDEIFSAEDALPSGDILHLKAEADHPMHVMDEMELTAPTTLLTTLPPLEEEMPTTTVTSVAEEPSNHSTTLEDHSNHPSVNVTVFSQPEIQENSVIVNSSPEAESALNLASPYGDYLFYYTPRSYFHFSKNYCIDPHVSQTTDEIMNCLKLMQEVKPINAVLNKLLKILEFRFLNVNCGNNTRRLNDSDRISFDDAVDALSRSWFPPGFLPLTNSLDKDDERPTRTQVIREALEAALVSLNTVSNHRLQVSEDGQTIFLQNSELLMTNTSCQDTWVNTLFPSTLNETSFPQGSEEQEKMFELIERIITQMESLPSDHQSVDVDEVKEQVLTPCDYAGDSRSGIYMVWDYAVDFVSNSCQRIQTTWKEDGRVTWKYLPDRETAAP